MESIINYDSLLILSLLAFVTPLFINAFKKYKVPFVVGELFVGIIIGKSFLNLIQVDAYIEFLSNLGLAYLMFLSGLEIDVHSLKFTKNKGESSLIVCILMTIMSFAVSFGICQLLFSLKIIKNVLFMTFLFGTSAPGFLVPFLKQRGLLKTQLGQTLLIFSILGEFTSLIAMTIISARINYGLDYRSFLFVIVLIASFLIYLLLKSFQKKYSFDNFSGSSMHLEVRAAFALILILVTISNKMDTEIALGSFLAGVIFAFLTDKSREEDLKYKLDIIGYGFLIPIFFIMIGVNLDIKSVFNNPKYLLNIPFLLIVIFIIKLIPSMLLTRKFNKRQAISSSILLSSQLSIMIVGAQIALSTNLINSSTYSSLILTAVISCMLFPFLFDKLMVYDNIEDTEESSINKVSVREIIPTNKEIFNVPLKELKFPKGSRVFLIIRDYSEIVPTGDTMILEGDVLVVAYLNDSSECIIKMLK